ncbi:MAG: amidase [Gemmatimonadales bacterium]|jgi:Asp-tRNA(Asn)/Glu-tRNA(Gln) amidotransferase A subunit family amidase
MTHHDVPRAPLPGRDPGTEVVRMLDRRLFLAACSRMGLGASLFPGTLWALAHRTGTVTKDMIEQAAIIADVPIPPEYRDAMLGSLNDFVDGYDAIHDLHLPNSVAPALDFNPAPPAAKVPVAKAPMRMSAPRVIATRDVPRNIEDLCYATVRHLATLMKGRKISSAALTDMYLARLGRLDPRLHCVITLTADRARAQAAEADRDIAAGKYRGPLHGLPWGAKDLLAVKGYPTTWGAGGFEHQMIDENATVVQRLDAAGAILIAKLTLGALALGDVWYGGITRNPWRTEQGSSGSSAGPASATAAGCVAFSIGSETLGSIASPSTRCGCTGLRPTFGLVPRTGAMALSWSMDKLGPICRSVEDCAIVLDAIHGPDGHDRTVHPSAFNWDASIDWRTLRVGVLEADFAAPPIQPPAASSDTAGSAEDKKRRETAQRQQAANQSHADYDRKFGTAALAKLRAMGVTMTPVELPKLPWAAMRSVLLAEAAASFDDLTRSGRDKLLTSQGPNDWPNSFRTARFIPAVEYIQANRARMMGIEQMAAIFDRFDVVVAPTFSVQLVVTNLTGHPALILPNGFRGDDAPAFSAEPGAEYGGPGTPVSLTFLGPLHGEARLLAFARAYQDATGFHEQHPSV